VRPGLSKATGPIASVVRALGSKTPKAGFSPASCGWVDQEDLARDPTMAPPHLHLAVFRIRQIFDRAGVVDSVLIVERRNTPRQLRIGCSHLRVVPL
jgi:hypothetical protein